MNTASVATGIRREKLRKIAATGEIEGARKECGSWVFETEKLKSWMGDADPTLQATEPLPVYDIEANRPMHAAIEVVESLVNGVAASELLQWWARYIGKGFDADTVARARAWINHFADGYPAAERARQALLARIPEENAA